MTFKTKPQKLGALAPALTPVGGALVTVGVALLKDHPDWTTVLFVAAVLTFVAAFCCAVAPIMFDPEGRPEKTVPLYKAARWIAKDSAWGANQTLDLQWLERVDEQLKGALATGRLRAWGTFWSRKTQHSGKSEISFQFWLEQADFSLYDLLFPTVPIRNVRYRSDPGEARYRDVEVSKSDLKRIWPLKSLWARLRRQSAAECVTDDGLGKGGKAALVDRWKDQDNALLREEPRSAFEHVFGDDHGRG